MMTPAQTIGTVAEIRRYLRTGAITAGVLIFGVGGWSLVTEVAGAVPAPGQLVVDSNVKKVQHPWGGVVAELKVQDGVRVESGDLLVRLDDTITRSNLAVIDRELLELAARQARAEAERDGAEAISFPAGLVERADDPIVAEVVHGEERLFAIRRSARDGQKAQLLERVGQLEQESRGQTGQLRAKDSESSLIAKELDSARQLWESRLITLMRLTALERDAARIDGMRAELAATIAKTKGRLNEVRLQLLQIDQDLSAEVGKTLAEIRARTAELTEKRAAADDQLKRVEIRAPQSGIVHQLTAHTIGGVIPPGEAIMLIVPDADGLSVESMIEPQQIDRVWMGQKAALRFTAFNQRTTPELFGEITRISADITHDPKTGAPFYTVRIKLSATEAQRLGGLKLLPGMPVEGFIQTGSRTVASYLTKPFRDHLAKAWRED